MDIEVYEGLDRESLTAPAHVPAAVVRAAVDDARSPVPTACTGQWRWRWRAGRRRRRDCDWSGWPEW